MCHGVSQSSHMSHSVQRLEPRAVSTLAIHAVNVNKETAHFRAARKPALRRLAFSLLADSLPPTTPRGRSVE